MVACARPEQDREDELVDRRESVEDPSMILTAQDGENDTLQETNDWPTAEGYTPLGDMMNLGENVLFAMPPTSLNDDEECDNFIRNGVYSSGPSSFAADPSALFSRARFPEDENDTSHDGETNREAGSPETTPANDFDGVYRDTASIALMALEEDYQMTLRGQVRPSMLDEQTTAAPAMPMLDASSFCQPQNFADFNSPEADINSSQHYKEPRGNNETEPNAATELPKIDTEAVKKAVAGIINNTSDKFSDKMKRWQDQQKEAIKGGEARREHSLIPAVSLKAFRRETPKAIQATVNLTRSATISEALHRLSEVLQSQDCLSIHIVGADHVECASEVQMQTHFAPLARWIGANIYSPRNLNISFIGPNVPTAMANLPDSTDLIVPCQQHKIQRLHTATAKCYEASYHDWLEEQQAKEGGNLPDAVFCFNAGIWGYDEWRPSICSVVNMKRKIPFVVTSYTLFEAEEDYDVIKEAFQATAGEDYEASKTTSKSKQGCIWEPETNGFGSKQKRETVTAVQGREYRENSAWQAWRF